MTYQYNMGLGCPLIRTHMVTSCPSTTDRSLIVTYWRRSRNKNDYWRHFTQLEQLAPVFLYCLIQTATITGYSTKEGRPFKCLKRVNFLRSYQECRRLPEPCVNISLWFWSTKIQTFLQRTEILLIRCDWATDIHGYIQVCVWLLHTLCGSNKTRYLFNTNQILTIVEVLLYLFVFFTEYGYRSVTKQKFRFGEKKAIY